MIGLRRFVPACLLLLAFACIASATEAPYGDGQQWWSALDYRHQSKKAIAGGLSSKKLDATATTWQNHVTGEGVKVTKWQELHTRTVEQSADGAFSIATTATPPGSTYTWVASLAVSGNGAVTAGAAKGGKAEALCKGKLIVKGHLYCYVDKLIEVTLAVPMATAETADVASDTWTVSSGASNKGTGQFYISSESSAKGAIKVQAWNPLQTSGAAVDRVIDWVRGKLGMGENDNPTAEQVTQELMGATHAKAGSELTSRVRVETVTAGANGSGFWSVFGITHGRATGDGEVPVGPGPHDPKNRRPGEVKEADGPPLAPPTFGSDPEDRPAKEPKTDEDVPHHGTDDTPIKSESK